MLGLPNYVHACCFGLDGVLTDTAGMHAAAWKEVFDGYLQARAADTGERFMAFDAVRDFETYVDGRPRELAARQFLRSRGITLRAGHAEGPSDVETLAGLSARTNETFLRLVREHGVSVYPGSLRYLEALRASGVPTAVVSCSGNAQVVLHAAGIAHQFDAHIDATVATHQDLKGKPALDTLLAAAHALHMMPSNTAVFEDSPDGVEAGRSGGFGWVVGVDRRRQRGMLLRHGADVVVDDLAELIGIDDVATLLDAD